MNEKNILNIFGFLVNEYNFKYRFEEFSIYPPMITDTYSFYNKNGSFTIAELAQRGEIDYIVLDNIDQLNEFFHAQYEIFYGKSKIDYCELRKQLDDINRHYINIFKEEPQIWKKIL